MIKAIIYVQKREAKAKKTNKQKKENNYPLS